MVLSLGYIFFLKAVHVSIKFDVCLKKTIKVLHAELLFFLVEVLIMVVGR